MKTKKSVPKSTKTGTNMKSSLPAKKKTNLSKKMSKTDDIEALQEELKQKMGSKSFEDFVNDELDSEDGSFEFEDEGEDLEDEEDVDEDDLSEEETQQIVSKKSKKGKKPQKEEAFDFDASDSDDEEQVHQLPDKLEVASDESDFEDDDADESSKPRNALTQSDIDQWQSDLETDTTTKTLSHIIGALNSALATLHNEESKSQMRVEGSTAFNSIVRLCLLNVIPAFRKLLKISGQEKKPDPTKSNNWAKVKLPLRQYLVAVVKLLNGVHSENLLSVVLKHSHQAMHFFAFVPKASKLLIKRLLTLWSAGEESVRVLAFMCLLKLCTITPGQFLEPVMKGMYLAFVKNAKFTSPKTWPGINFMRRSLVEIFALDDRLAYKHGFLYIRQLAIHLRNAMTLKKKDSLQVVYNWQFVHSLHFWASVIGASPASVNVKQLIYPLTQVAIGTINLMPTAKYYPLRFHCSKILSQLSLQAGVFIPVLPFYMDVLQNHNFNRKLAKNENFKPLDMSCILKVSTSQLKEGSYRDSVIHEIHNGIVEYAATVSHKIAFPEMVFPAVMQIRNFVKKCTVVSCTKKMKSVMDKVIENSKFIEDKRKAATFGIADTQAIDSWETQLRISGTPFSKFYTVWKKTQDRESIRRAAKIDSVSFDDIPVIKKRDKVAKEEEDEEFEGLFPSGDEDESDDEDRFLPKEERSAPKKRPAEVEQKSNAKTKRPRKGKNVQPQSQAADEFDQNGGNDEVTDLHLSDLDSDKEEANTAFGSDDESDDGSDDE